MTTLTFAISRSLAHLLKPGDEIVLTRMDHDGNVMPWYQMAQERGITVKWLNFNRETYRYDLDELKNLLSGNVKLLAVNYASNAIGTINDIRQITELAHAAGALVYVDAVQYVPHGPTDVQQLNCDFLACSAYKFFGPHQGILWGKYNLLDKLPAYKVRPADDLPPGKFETGTQSHEGQAGTLGALEYLHWIGQEMGQECRSDFPEFTGRRLHLHLAMQAIREYEKNLSRHLITGLKNIAGIKIHGITEPAELDLRVPTVSFTMKGSLPAEVAGTLGKQNIYTWDGDFYALEVIKHLGLENQGGMLRVGAVHYNTVEEIDRFLNGIEISGIKT